MCRDLYAVFSKELGCCGLVLRFAMICEIDASSKYTYSLHGAAAKAKANASQGIPEMLEIAVGRHFRENSKKKHSENAAYGWYRYDSRFALPVYGERGEEKRYNVFHASMLIRHAEDGKMYLYDIIDIKKETSNPLKP